MAVLTPQPKMQFTTAAGVPLSGGKVYTYIAGTTTPQATFTDYTGATPNANPVILDSRGEANIWLGAALYKFKLTDANDVEIWTVDYISAPTSGISPVLSGNVVIDSDTPGPALKITQTGTGPVLRVQDSTDPDTTPFIIDTSGNLGLGTPTPTAQLEATGAAKIGSLTLTSAPLPVASGGTGLGTLTANNLLVGAGTGNVTFVAPGTSGNVLTSNGTIWESQAPVVVSSTDRQVFNSSGTWTKPSGFGANSPVLIEAWGAGGSGGRGGNAGGGGGGGGYNSRWTVLSALGATETVTVGAGGVSRATNQTGATGGNSSFGTHITAFGGAGGGTFTSPSSTPGGGGGGQLSAGSGANPGRPLFISDSTSGVYQGGVSSAAGGNINDAMFHGGAGTDLNIAIVGGSSVWGGGGGGGHGGVTPTTAGTSSFGGNGGAGGATGTAGTQPGGGGGGSTSGNSGAGGAGRIIITVFRGA